MADIDLDIMRLLPDSGASHEYISTPALHQKLEQAVFDAPCKRTVQRRLYALQDDGFVESERHGNAVMWRRKAGANGIASKAGSLMTFDEALALQTLRRFASRQVPVLVSDALSSMYAMAETRLARPQSERERKIASWPQKVAIESASFQLQRPVIDSTLFTSVSYALFEERKLDIGYRARHNGGLEKSQVILPLGLVEVGTLVYLIGQRDTRPEPFMYRLDRIVRAEVLLESFRYPASFSLDQYVRTQRSFDFLVEKEIALDLKFSHHAGHHLLESPFAPDQTHEQQDDVLRVRGTVMLSQRLRWWLRSFGPHVEVLSPQSLRQELAAEVRELARIYCESCSSVA